jgi:phosphatidylglycerophosphate synthase
MTISNDSRDRVKGAFVPLALAMGRAGLTPDALTIIGFAITVVGAVLLSQQAWLLGGLVVFDRAGEIIVYTGIVAGLLGLGAFDLALLATATMGSAVMVSYTRSKAEGLGFTAATGMAAIGVMPREVRLVILSVGLIVAGAVGMYACECGAPWPVPQSASVNTPGGGILFVALGIITLGSIITTIQRILHVRSQAKHTTQQAGIPASNGDVIT